MIGPFTHDGSNPGFPYTVIFEGERYRWVQEGQIGREDPPERWTASGDYVDIVVDGNRIRIRHTEDGTLRASVRGTYVVGERTETFCALYEPGTSRCRREATRVIQDRRPFEREIVIRRKTASG